MLLCHHLNAENSASTIHQRKFDPQHAGRVESPAWPAHPIATANLESEEKLKKGLTL
jgi:hypothetical protein